MLISIIGRARVDPLEGSRYHNSTHITFIDVVLRTNVVWFPGKAPPSTKLVLGTRLVLVLRWGHFPTNPRMAKQSNLRHAKVRVLVLASTSPRSTTLAVAVF